MKDSGMDVAGEARKVKSENRRMIDLLSSRIGLLAGTDKALMTMHLKNGSSFRQISRLTGINEVNVARKIHKLTERLIDGQYIICLRNRKIFTGHEMVIAKEYFLRGVSIRQIAAKNGTSIYRIRKIVTRIEKLIAIIGQRNPEAA